MMSGSGNIAKFFVHVPGTPFLEIDGGFRNLVAERPLLVQGPRGHTALVRLTSMGGKVFLGSGWPEFLTENKIHENDILLCELDQKLKMKVQICNQAVQTQMYVTRSFASATKDRKQSKDKKRKTEGGEDKVKADDGEEDSEFKAIQIQGKEKGQSSVEEGNEEALATQKFEVRMEKVWLERGINIPAEFAVHMPPKGKGVLIIGPDNSEMPILHTGSRPYLGNGWQNFKQHHGLKLGDLLRFEVVAEFKWKMEISRRV